MPLTGTAKTKFVLPLSVSLCASVLAAVLLWLLTAELAEAQAQTVPADWDCIPKDASDNPLFTANQSFRLLFVTSDRTAATSSDLSTYNSFVQNAAKQNSCFSTFNDEFRALISTRTVHARDNSGTAPAGDSYTSGEGVPIYWVGGDKVADDYADFYDGSWDSSTPKNQRGGRGRNTVWTGSYDNGTRRLSHYAGQPQVRFGHTHGGATEGEYPFNTAGSRGPGTPRSLYGLSPVITVQAPQPQRDPDATSTPTSTPTSTLTLVPTPTPTPTATVQPPPVATVQAAPIPPAALILRIEPAVRSVVVNTRDEFILAVNVYGRQDILDNSLADKDPANRRPEFEWSSNRRGSFDEAVTRREWRNGLPDDRTVHFTAPDHAGRIIIDITLESPRYCLGAREGESDEDHIARCSARIDVRVRAPATIPPETKAPPVNPTGNIPDTVTDSDGVVYEVFTPEGGGDITVDGCSVTAGPGAVHDGEFIGISIKSIGDASKLGESSDRYTLAGIACFISVVDSSGDTVSDYDLDEPISVCMPVPDHLRASINRVVVVTINRQSEVTGLSTSVKINPEGIIGCGNLSSLPIIVAIATSGPHPVIATPDPTPQTADVMPDTGGVKPTWGLLLTLLLLGSIAAILPLALRRKHVP